MATTGEKLVELSSLSTGTALAHLLAITGGGGTGQTIYVDRIFADVQMELDGNIEADIAGDVEDRISAAIDDELAAELDDNIGGDIDP